MSPNHPRLKRAGEGAVSILAFPFVLIYAAFHFLMVLAPAIIVFAVLVWAIRFLLGLI